MPLNQPQIEDILRQAGLSNAANEARWLCQHAKRANLSDAELLLLARRRAQQEPLQYVLQETEFFDSELAVGPGVLIPRPETEELVEYAANHYRRQSSPGRILDLCTGSGAIAVSLARLFPEAQVLATDISPLALAWAEKNKVKYHLDNLELRQSDLFQQIPREFRFSLLTANPPYVSRAEYAELPHDVRDYEPELALVAAEDGCAFYRMIAEQARPFLLAGAELFLEIGETQGQRIKEIFTQQEYQDVRILQDMSGKDRIIFAKV